MVECVHQPEGAGIEIGQSFSLGSTYCAITLPADDVVSIDDMRTSAYSEHPCYEAFRLESYLGAPIRVDGELYGTLNFSSPDARPRRWSETDRDLVRLLALWVESAISRDRLNRRLGDVVRELGQSNRDLRERNEDLDFYAQHASHDLQAPLKNILALMDLFALEDGIPAQVTEDLGLSPKKEPKKLPPASPMKLPGMWGRAAFGQKKTKKARPDDARDRGGRARRGYEFLEQEEEVDLSFLRYRSKYDV